MISQRKRIEIEKPVIAFGAGLALLSGYALGHTPKGFIAAPVIGAYSIFAYQVIKSIWKNESLKTLRKVKETTMVVFFYSISAMSLITFTPKLYNKSFVLTSSLLLSLGIILLYYWAKWNKPFHEEILPKIFNSTLSKKNSNHVFREISKKKAEDFLHNFQLITSFTLMACSISLLAYRIFDFVY